MIPSPGHNSTFNHDSGTQFNVEFKPRVIFQCEIKTRSHFPTWNHDPGSNFNIELWSICNGCGMPAGNAYHSGHLVPSRFWGLHVLRLLRPVSRLYIDFDPPKLTFTELRGFHGVFATGVACQQGALTLPDTWFRPPFWDLLMLQLLRPNSSNLPCLYSTFHLEYPLVLSRFCL